MKSSRSQFSISSGTIRQSVAAVGVITSLAFVGMQIRESNIQARAAAYQAIGISTAEFHRGFRRTDESTGDGVRLSRGCKKLDPRGLGAHGADIYCGPSHAGDHSAS